MATPVANAPIAARNLLGSIEDVARGTVGITFARATLPFASAGMSVLFAVAMAHYLAGHSG
ncbi:MAG TPA: hypothetical protein VHG27_05280 [Xanthobacteraceae bacterium]|nr:hypothetical protein [Xanthobacteraceae bacterium]